MSWLQSTMVRLLTQVKFVQGLTAVDAETLTAEQALAMAISLTSPCFASFSIRPLLRCMNDFYSCRSFWPGNHDEFEAVRILTSVRKMAQGERMHARSPCPLWTAYAHGEGESFKAQNIFLR